MPKSRMECRDYRLCDSVKKIEQVLAVPTTPNAKFVLEADNIAPRGHNGLGEVTQRSVVGDICMTRDACRELLAVV
jgi:hypothetical protein